MHRTLASTIILGGALAVASAVAVAQSGSSTSTTADLGQSAGADVLLRYHYIDQGTRLLPVAWMLALEKPDGSGKVLNRADLERYGFLFDSQASPGNPNGWPIGWTVSDPTKSDGVSVAGFSCPMCHTGRIDYKGTSMVVEGGQSMIDLYPFLDQVYEALAAVARDPAQTEKFMAAAIAAGYPADRMEQDFKVALERLASQGGAGKAITTLPAGPGRVDAVQGISNRAFGVDLMVPENLRDATAPVSYPYLWDIWRLNWLLYNAVQPNNPDFRNIGEVLGVEATTNFVDSKGNLNPEPLRWQSSIQINGLREIEEILKGVKAPVWPEAVLGEIDEAKANAGRSLFVEHCVSCHGIKELPDGNWDVPVIPLADIGTDPGQATNFSGYTYDLSKIGLSTKAQTWEGLQVAVNGLQTQAYIDAGIPESDREGKTEVISPCGYKARPLIGVWATSPFLHNGSVRTLFDMISETRPDSFRYGTREYDPAHLGYTEDVSAHDATLDATIPGNLNTGHWFTDDQSRPGRIGPAFADDDKLAVLEYLKSATYENYPSESRATAAAIPCAADKTWALK
jgi:hypothetical protein